MAKSVKTKIKSRNIKGEDIVRSFRLTETSLARAERKGKAMGYNLNSLVQALLDDFNAQKK